MKQIMGALTIVGFSLIISMLNISNKGKQNEIERAIKDSTNNAKHQQDVMIAYECGWYRGAYIMLLEMPDIQDGKYSTEKRMSEFSKDSLAFITLQKSQLN